MKTQVELPPGFEIRELTSEEYQPLWKELAPQVFADSHMFDLMENLTEAELAGLNPLKENLKSAYTLRLGVFHKGKMVAWANGNQDWIDSYYMRNSAVMPEHRRKGLYKALLFKTLEITSQKGFLKVHSNHVTVNNSVIIAKLQAGFVITGLEVSDKMGTLVQLSYFHKPLRRKVLDYRSGQTKPDEEVRRALKM